LSTIIENYLENVKDNLRLESSDEKEIITELANHIEDEVQDLKRKGFQDEEAASACIGLLGSAKALAHRIYEARSQGSWQQALMACLPHILFGLMFVLNWWRGMGWLLAVLIVVLSTTVYGWWHRKSSWLFPWLGYSFLPVLAAGLSLLYLPKTLAWLAILIYVPLTLWLIYRVVSHTIKQDWVYLSLMLLPMPIIISWFLVAERRAVVYGLNIDSLAEYGPWIGLSFLALALSVVSFVRLRRRWLKISALFLTGVITSALIGAYAWGRIELITFLLLILFQASIFLIPALLENGARSGRWGRIFEHKPTF
jgi:hypothetical protein